MDKLFHVSATTLARRIRDRELSARKSSRPISSGSRG